MLSDGAIEARRETAEAWHTLAVDEAARRLRTDTTRGLSAAEVSRRYTQYGPNTLADIKGRSTLSIFIHQFRSLIVALLLAAGGVALALGENVEAVAILIVIVLNAAIGFLTEWKAEQALVGLRKQTVSVAHVVRDGAEQQIPAAELVPGDLAILAAGARVPADGRVVENIRLQVEEAALTGESLAVSKTDGPLPDKDAPLGDRVNMVHMGTAVTDGRARFIVTATGMGTEMGKIGTLIEEAGTRVTPLEGKLAQLGRALLLIVPVLCAIIALAGWLRGNSFLYMLEIAISLAIAAVPEGLPAVATMTLALGMQRMAQRHALIRRLPAVETLGSTTVICTDKTGTLTRNEMTVRAVQLDERRVEVTGTGYAPTGESRVQSQWIEVPANDPLRLALRIGALCNDAKVDRTDGTTTILGDPTEGALIIAAEKAGLVHVALESDYPRVGEIPFNSETRSALPASSRFISSQRCRSSLQFLGDRDRLRCDLARLAAASGGSADLVAQHDHRRVPRDGPGRGKFGPRRDEATTAQPQRAADDAPFRRADRLARSVGCGSHTAGVLRRHALVRHRRRRPPPRGHDSVHDARIGAGLPHIQRAFPNALGVYRRPVHERLALGGGAGLSAPPGRSRLRAASAGGVGHRPAQCRGLGSDRRLRLGPGRHRGARQDSPATDPHCPHRHHAGGSRQTRLVLRHLEPV